MLQDGEALDEEQSLVDWVQHAELGLLYTIFRRRCHDLVKVLGVSQLVVSVRDVHSALYCEAQILLALFFFLIITPFLVYLAPAAHLKIVQTFFDRVPTSVETHESVDLILAVLVYRKVGAIQIPSFHEFDKLIAMVIAYLFFFRFVSSEKLAGGVLVVAEEKGCVGLFLTKDIIGVVLWGHESEDVDFIPGIKPNPVEAEILHHRDLLLLAKFA